MKTEIVPEIPVLSAGWKETGRTLKMPKKTNEKPVIKETKFGRKDQPLPHQDEALHGSPTVKRLFPKSHSELDTYVPCCKESN